MITPILGYPSRTAAIEALASQGLDAAAICAMVGGSRNNVQRLLWHANKRVGDRRIVLPRASIDLMQAEARRRELNVVELAQLLIETIARDDLFDALLGEAEPS